MFQHSIFDIKGRTRIKARLIAAICGLAVLLPLSATNAMAADKTPPSTSQGGLPPLTLPKMDPIRGKHLFAERGCVLCHSVNNVGGTEAPNLDAANQPDGMDPFAFFARMWRGAIPMVALQMHDLGYQVDFGGQDLADIMAFVYDARAQESFTEADLPPKIKEMIDNDTGGRHNWHVDGMDLPESVD